MSAEDEVREEMAADRRLVILRLLVEYGSELNTRSLEKSLRRWGHGYADLALINDDVRWLAQRRLVKTEGLTERLLMVGLREDGALVAAGKKWVEGVARPS